MGGLLPANFSRSFGLLTPKIKPVDEKSERYIESLLARRASVPASYSAVSAGIISSVKSQGECGSCVAFASMAAIETCLKKASGGKLADFSEQQVSRGCNGAQTPAYIKYVTDTKLALTHESTYPYLNKNPKLTCPANLKAYNTGAKVVKSYYTYSGTEAKLKALVAEHGAVVTAVNASPLSKYAGGIFS